MEEIPITEQENPRTAHLSALPAAEIVRLMNEEDTQVAEAVGRVGADIARAVDEIVERLRGGGGHSDASNTPRRPDVPVPT